jgi:hypothetical protein
MLIRPSHDHLAKAERGPQKELFAALSIDNPRLWGENKGKSHRMETTK